MARYTTGIRGLDEHVAGGLPQESVVLLSGGPGTGKTLMGLTYVLEGAKKGENCCYLTFNEGREDLLKACGLKSLTDVEKYLGKNLEIAELDMGTQMDVQGICNLLESYPPTDRLVIDNVNKLLIHAESNRQYRVLLSGIIHYLRKNVGSTVLICETEKKRLDTKNGEAFECDGVISLSLEDLEEKPRRLLSVKKLRYSSIEPGTKRDYAIDEQGVYLTGKQIL